MPEFPRFCQASTVIRNSFIDSLNHFLIFKANVLIQQLPQMERALFLTDIPVRQNYRLINLCRTSKTDVFANILLSNLQRYGTTFEERVQYLLQFFNEFASMSEPQASQLTR